MSDEKQGSMLGNLGSWFKGRLPFFYSNWITTLGSVVSLVAVALLFMALLINLYNAFLNRAANPYVGMITFMLLPGLLVAGIVMILLGTLVHRRRRRLGKAGTSAVEIGGAEFWRKAALVGLLAVLGMIVFTSFGYEAYHYTDSSEFCMKVCHEVMKPEGVAYERSPHANVECVECHIGPGAQWFVKAKISGLRQVVAVLGGTYSRPIPAPVHDLRPARETCEVCHWPTKFHGSKLITRKHTEPDRENTRSLSSLVMKVGGHPQPGVRATGVHWHVDPANEVRYRAVDEKRQVIVEVVQKTPDGEITYALEDAESGADEGEWRVMDCIDCHNRPTHIFEAPGQALDEAFAAGLLDRGVPWLRKTAERALQDVVPGEDTAGLIADYLTEAYTRDHPEELSALRAALPGAAMQIADILERNVFPGMAITWGTYASNLGHMDIDGEMADTGCFRCHDEMHVSEVGRCISQDCDACHTLLSERETDPDALPEYVAGYLRGED
ncbi:NapC/NirT family cytochrome c [bacterium]|nr:NapC/NirT family cytochrome c [bacterium]MBU1073423.1 NapC/NirT family cytochrome c [bacterium]MBU1674985.1 NapC/NirT family cytochrome c [bacterium]